LKKKDDAEDVAGADLGNWSDRLDGKTRRERLGIGVALLLIGLAAYQLYAKITVAPIIGVVPVVPTQAVAGSNESPDFVVYVSGMVQNPGVIRIKAGSRSIDAINAAGGVTAAADMSKVNLAKPLKDGAQVDVPAKSSGARGVLPQSSNYYSISDKININVATAQEFDKLPGVGPALAERIVDYRKANGPFRNGVDLKKISGVSDSKYEQFKDKIVW